MPSRLLLDRDTPTDDRHFFVARSGTFYGRAVANLLEQAERSWWSVGLGNVRPASGTYGEFDYDGLPPLNPDDYAAMDWLPDGPEQLWAITDVHDQQPSRPFDASGLRGLNVPVPLPDAFSEAAASPSRLSGIRSRTGCYLDLGDFAMAVDEEAGGYLIHFLSDQQWAFHWLIYANPVGQEAVIVSREPIGFEPIEDLPTPTPPLQIENHDLAICADSFAEFLYRFWLENEIAWREEANQLVAPFDSYLRHYGVRGAQPSDHEPEW